VSRRAAAACLCALLPCAFLLLACGGREQAGTSTPSVPPEREVVSPRSAPFQRYSGNGPLKLRLAEFGTEASREDRLKAQARIDAFLAATGRGQWEHACGYVSEVLRAQIAELIRNSRRSPRPSCGEVLQGLAFPRGGKAPRSLSAPQGIASLRIKEGPGGGFALFHGSDGADHWIAVRREGGSWQVLSPAPQIFE
jgi:hypothetical protein